MDLKEKTCIPCEGGMPSLTSKEVTNLLGQVPGWEAGADKTPPPGGGEMKLHKTYRFDDFLAAMAFVDKVAALAEEQAHHPDFCVHYNVVDITLWTHAVKGLSENDFILAAKIDAILM
jgi:4a-hydroxytetrahydrobiopterin dehydratase